jgi:hypothetical protein
MLIFKFGVGSRRKAVYCEFYRCYDPDADFARMKSVGVFQSIDKDNVYHLGPVQEE